jgi:shikimate dehydrogenase
MRCDQYGVVGNPVAHSRSPEIHAQFARATRQALEYRRIEAPLDGFEAAVDAFRRQGGKGLNVTVPFKESAYRYCARASDRARRAEVVNTLVFTASDVYGDTTDGPGLVADLTRNLRVSLLGKEILLMGAGGAARAVVPSLLEAGAARLVVANRTVTRAQALAARFGVEASGYAELDGERFDLVVNATSAGLADAAPRLPASVFKPGALAYDMVYGRDTPFLLQARAAGARIADGLGMLVEQAAESFFIWRGVRPDTRSVLERLHDTKNAG